MMTNSNSYWSHKRLVALIELVGTVHGLDLSPFDATFLVKALDKRVTASVETAAAYGERLALDFHEAEALLQSQHSCLRAA